MSEISELCELRIMISITLKHKINKKTMRALKSRRYAGGSIANPPSPDWRLLKRQTKSCNDSSCNTYPILTFSYPYLLSLATHLPCCLEEGSPKTKGVDFTRTSGWPGSFTMTLPTPRLIFYRLALYIGKY